MPELPEVETIRNNLRQGSPDNPSLLGLTIRDAQVFWERSIAQPDADSFRSRIVAQTIQEIGRRGKYLVFDLSQDAMLIHLRMSGDLLVEQQSAPLAPHHRVIINFETPGNVAHGQRLAFNDTRKFGRLWLLSNPQDVLSSLGPEPLDPDFTAEELHRRLQSHKRQLKPLLLDQSFLAGLGNIYTDEALHLARLHPLTRSNQLGEAQSELLWASIRQTLMQGIHHNGASIDWVYRGGSFQDEVRVYQRTGEPCPECGALIQRIVVGQRGTHYCPLCQPEP